MYTYTGQQTWREDRGGANCWSCWRYRPSAHTDRSFRSLRLARRLCGNLDAPIIAPVFYLSWLAGCGACAVGAVFYRRYGGAGMRRTRECLRMRSCLGCRTQVARTAARKVGSGRSRLRRCGIGRRSCSRAILRWDSTSFPVSLAELISARHSDILSSILHYKEQHLGFQYTAQGRSCVDA